MGQGMKARWRKAALAAAAAAALAATSACTSDDTEPEEDPTTVHEAQITPPDPEETPSQEATSDSDDNDGHDDSDHDHHTVLGGDLEDAPSPEDVEEMQDVAEAYWVAFNQRDYDHPDGIVQSATKVQDLVTEEYFEELYEALEYESQSVYWTEFVFDESRTRVEVELAAFEPNAPFTADSGSVTIQGWVNTATSGVDRAARDGAASLTTVELVRTDDGWKVSGTAGG